VASIFSGNSLANFEKINWISIAASAPTSDIAAACNGAQSAHPATRQQIPRVSSRNPIWVKNPKQPDSQGDTQPFLLWQPEFPVKDFQWGHRGCIYVLE